MKYTDMSINFGMVEIPNVQQIPLATTGDEVRVQEITHPNSKVETDAEMLEVVEKSSYEGHNDTKEAMVDAAAQASLVDTPFNDTITANTTSKVTSSTRTEIELMH